MVLVALVVGATAGCATLQAADTRSTETLLNAAGSPGAGAQAGAGATGVPGRTPRTRGPDRSPPSRHV